MDLQSVCYLKKGYTLIEVEEGTFILPTSSSGIIAEELYSINSAGARVLSFLDGEASIGMIVENLKQFFAGEDASMIACDALEFLDSLSKQGLLEIKD